MRTTKPILLIEDDEVDAMTVQRSLKEINVTNHLDIVTQTWFYAFLRQAPFGFMLVAHDRYFLDNVVSKIYELDHGKINAYNGNFSHYCAQKEQRLIVQENAYKNQQREIARKKRTIERFREVY